jgi:hypothetical protein
MAGSIRILFGMLGIVISFVIIYLGFLFMFPAWFNFANTLSNTCPLLPGPANMCLSLLSLLTNLGTQIGAAFILVGFFLFVGMFIIVFRTEPTEPEYGMGSGVIQALNRPALAVQLIIFALTIIVMGIMFGMLGPAVSQSQAYQQTNYPSGTFDPSLLTAFAQEWYWFPFGFLMAMFIWLVLRAREKVSPGGLI